RKARPDEKTGQAPARAYLENGPAGRAGGAGRVRPGAGRRWPPAGVFVRQRAGRGRGRAPAAPTGRGGHRIHRPQFLRELAGGNLRQPGECPIMNFYAIRAIYLFEMARAWRTLMQSVASPVVSTAL